MGPPPCAVAAQVANQLAASEEIISRIRARDQETEAKAVALFALLHGEDEVDRGPMKFVVEISNPERPKPEEIK
jgi:hypothetical protein